MVSSGVLLSSRYAAAGAIEGDADALGVADATALPLADAVGVAPEPTPVPGEALHATVSAITAAPNPLRILVIGM